MKAKGKKKQARDVAYWSEAASVSFTEDLLNLMGDGVSQAELARRVGVSRGYISRVFRGVENLTLETMTKLAIAVGGSVRLHVASQDRVTRWTDVPSVANVVLEEVEKSARVTTSDRSKNAVTEQLPAKARHHK